MNVNATKAVVQEPPGYEGVTSHWRYLALSESAQVMYLALTKHASPLGDVVLARVVQAWASGHQAFEELMNADLVVPDDDEEDCWHIVRPSTLDEAESLDRGDVG